MDRKISDLNKEITGIMNNASLTEEEKKLNSATALEIINQIEKSRHNSIRLQTAARNKLEGETVSKYWSQLNKERTPRDTILALKSLGLRLKS